MLAILYPYDNHGYKIIRCLDGESANQQNQNFFENNSFSVKPISAE